MSGRCKLLIENLKMNEQLYRNSALEKLSSPEELDSLMRVTSLKAWLALIAFGALVLTAVVWGVWGTIPTKVVGQGILVHPEGLLEILSGGGGQVSAVYANPGDTVHKGQVLARLEQNKLGEEIKHAREELAEQKAEYEKISRYGDQDIKLRMGYLTKKRKDLEKTIQAGGAHLRWLRETLRNRRELLQQGLATKQSCNTTQEQIDAALLEVEKARSEVKDTEIQEFQAKEQRDREIIAKKQKIAQQERSVASLEYDREENSKIASPANGRVLEITAQQGELLEKGARILTLGLLEKAPNDLEAIVYVSPTQGKKVCRGMKILISPSSTKREESGSLLGKVSRVSEFPATPQGMMRSLQNEKLVQALSAVGAPIEVHCELTADPATPSGYKWSSGKGPGIRLQSGTLCTGSIVVEEQPPVNLVIPYLKKSLLGNEAEGS